VPNLTVIVPHRLFWEDGIAGALRAHWDAAMSHVPCILGLSQKLKSSNPLVDQCFHDVMDNRFGIFGNLM